ncbi:MAG TPA: HD-GYP domain-containing protein [Gammaproteobacteria bacterium]|nr:HD-GYP domain-containing protein [Gammaproteobacteria bacterium]
MLRKVDVINLRTGMYVAELDRPWVESPFLFQGFIIESDEDLTKLRESCKYVYVDDMKGPQLADNRLIRRTPSAAGTTAVGFSQAEKTAFTTDIKQTAQVRTKASANVSRVLNDVRMGKSLDTQDSKAVIETLVDNISHNPNSMLWLTNLRQKHERTANHCLNVSILAIAFGRHLGMGEDELNKLGLGAMLHDVGKMRTPPQVLDKPGKLTEEERMLVRKHPSDGYGVLKLSKQLPPEVLDIVMHHHERVDGRGYPDGLSGDAVSLPARIVGLVDAYDNLTGDSLYRAVKTPGEALRVLRSEGANEYGRELVQEFIRCLGIYPVGSIVQLQSSAVAMVVSSNLTSRLKPVILLLRDEDGENMRPRTLLNLSSLSDDKLADKWGIKGMVDPAEVGLDIPGIVSEEATAV